MDRPQIGVGLIIQKNHSILIHKRTCEHGKNTWACPGGHMEMWESFEQTALRELLEEVGDNIVVDTPRYFTARNTRFYNEGKHYIVIFMIANWISGEPINMEPDKGTNWEWSDIDNLPKPLMLGLEAILNDGTLHCAFQTI